MDAETASPYGDIIDFNDLSIRVKKRLRENSHTLEWDNTDNFEFFIIESHPFFNLDLYEILFQDNIDATISGGAMIELLQHKKDES